MRVRSHVVLGAFALTLLAADAEHVAPKRLANLGKGHHEITTSSKQAQAWFDQGLALTFGFNHDAAIRSFEQGARVDPACAMCWWGVALAHGPNINAPMGPEAARAAWDALQKAQAQAPKVSKRERAYIAALAKRYAADAPEDRKSLDVAYAEAMRDLHRADPSDLDAAVLYAEALMDLYPWDYWTDDAEPREHTGEILKRLEFVLERDPKHLGANHYYIHAVEEFYPKRAEAAADRLGDLALDAGHLVHMPSHIFWRLGRYDDALQVNVRAAAADEAFFASCRAGAFYRAAYYPHNIHFLWAAASTDGQSEVALAAARKLEARTRRKLGEFPFVEEFMATPLQTLVRFGRWDAVLGEPAPDAERRYLTGIRHYARGVAFTRKGDLAAAAAELKAVRSVRAEPAMQEFSLAGGIAPASQLLGIAEADLDGELAMARGRSAEGIAALTRAVELQDGLLYMEPPPWYLPQRQALGAALLDNGQAARAEKIYRSDLEQYPRNGWSLLGLSKSLRAQGRDDEAAIVEQGFENAWARADVKLETSRF
jgi:hypothetical protein